MNKVSKEMLYKLYVTQNKPMHTISKELSIAIGTVYNYLHKYNIQTKDKKETFNFKGRKHTDEAITKMSTFQKQKVVSQTTREKISKSKTKKGIGHKKKRKDGYVAIYFLDHPNSNKDGYIMEHDLIMSCYIGRNLRKDEVVHHINGKRDDNRIENLKLMTFKEHAKFHMEQRYKNKRSEDLLTK